MVKLCCLQATLSGAELAVAHPTEEELQPSGQLGGELVKKVTSVNVFEGQLMTWNLTLGNISKQSVTGCQVGDTHCGHHQQQMLLTELGL